MITIYFLKLRSLFTTVLKLSVLTIIMSSLFSSCKKFIELPAPPTSTNQKIVFSENATATAAMTGIYASMSNSRLDASSIGFTSLSVYPELSGDNLTLFAVNNSNYLPFYTNNLQAITINSASNLQFWLQFYPLIYRTNDVIQGVAASKTLSKNIADQLTGEALFTRALLNFYLVNLYGAIPLATTTDYTKTSILSRSSVDVVYQQLIGDLIQAKELLSETYLDATLFNETVERVRPNKYCAAALLARVYLFKSDYVNAEKFASEVIINRSKYDIIPLDQVFIKNSKETIWALPPVRTGENTQEARFYNLPSGPNIATNPVYLSNTLMQSFETNDQRKTFWTGNITVSSINYPYAFKYKIDQQGAAVNEYSILLRIAEQYLIRAEARAQQNNIDGAKADLNAIRIRAGLNPTTASTQESLLTAVLHDRRVELFTEWGHRWFDLKRTHNVDAAMSIATPLKGGIWDNRWQLYPIPASEIANNPSVTQNPGYPQ